MDLSAHVEQLRRQLLVAADGGGADVSAVAERLVAAVESAAWLTLLEALSAAAEEITGELAPASVELRLRGRDPHFVVTGLPADVRADAAADAPSATSPDPDPDPGAGDEVSDVDEGAMVRINLRLPEGLKRRVERAAKRDRLSVNAWLVRVVAEAVEEGKRTGPGRPGRRHTGWVR